MSRGRALLTGGAAAGAAVLVLGSVTGLGGPAAPEPAPSAATSAPAPDPLPTPDALPTPSSLPTLGRSASASASAEPTEVVQAGSGRLRVAPGGSGRSGPGPLRRYRVQVEGGLGIDADEFAAAVERTLADPRSWGAEGRLAFRRVSEGPTDLTVVLASPDTTDRLCLPLDTAGSYSCGVGDTAVINAMRWLEGAQAYEGRLSAYRQYVVNHEVGHLLGRSHEPCPGRGEPAPVMMQQTKGVGACAAQPWPYG